MKRFSLFLSQTAYALHLGQGATFLETFAAKGGVNAVMKLLLIYFQYMVLCWINISLPSLINSNAKLEHFPGCILKGGMLT